MDIGIRKIEANYAFCRGCGFPQHKVRKGELAFYVSVHGATQTGDREFHCMKCVPDIIERMKSVIKQYEDMSC